MCLVLGFVAVLAWPILPWSSSNLYDIAITATGDRDARSKGSEVWLTGLPEGMDADAFLKSATMPLGWERRGDALFSYRDQPSTLRFHGALARDAAFTFVRQGWSGGVTIEINGAARTENLFDPDPAGKVLVVGLREFPQRAGASTTHWTKFTVSGLLVAAALLLIFRLLDGLSVRSPLPESGYVLDAVRYALPSVAIFMLVLLGTWPAQMSPDSISQWWQLHTGDFSNHHPLVHTFFIGGPGYLLGSPGWSMAMQILLLALASGTMAAEARRWGLSRRATWSLAVLVPALPAVHLLSTTFWKDVPYAIAVAALTAMLMAMLRTNGGVVRRASFIGALALTLFLVATLRHNGLLVSAGVVVLVAVIWRRRLRLRFYAAGLAAGVALPVALTTFILPALGVVTVSRPYGGIIPLHLLGAMVAEDAVTEPDVSLRLDSILPIADWRAHYDCLSVVPLFWAQGINHDRIDSSLLGPALNAAVAFPGIAARHLLCVNSMGWRLSPTKDAQYSLTPLGVWQAPAPFDSLGLVEAPVTPAINHALKWEFATTTSGVVPFVMFWRPAFMLLLLAGSLAYVSIRNPAAAACLAIACAPTVLNVLSLVPVNGSQDFRYYLPIYLIGPYLMVAMINAARCSSSTGGAPFAESRGTVRPLS
ncbi:MAG: hypothetical protein M9944_14370 [Rhizobiaceae bacterium]|nr:hypothetical protein [Rhizobiaceae bacterium]